MEDIVLTDQDLENDKGLPSFSTICSAMSLSLPTDPCSPDKFNLVDELASTGDDIPDLDISECDQRVDCDSKMLDLQDIKDCASSENVEQLPQQQVYPCNVCGRKYLSQAAVSLHERKNHGICNTKMMIKCSETGCHYTSKTIQDLRQHLQKEHLFRFTILDSEFSNMSSFSAWKTQVEKRGCVLFVKKKSKNCPYEKVHYYYCHKSSLCNKKINGVYCTAYMNVREDFRSGKVKVSACLTHYAHSMMSSSFMEALSKRENKRVTCVPVQVVGCDVRLDAVTEKLLAIYDLAVTKKKQQSVNKICDALHDLYECLKDYDEDDQTLPGLEETQAWRRSAARQEAERRNSLVSLTPRSPESALWPPPVQTPESTPAAKITTTSGGKRLGVMVTTIANSG